MKKGILTNTELAALSLVIERDMHGYEMEELIESRGMRNWTEIGFSSIYYVLGRLEKAGFVASRLEKWPGKGPARRVFAATQAGRQRYRSELLRALSVPERPFPLFMQGLAGLPGLKDAEIADAFRRYRLGLQSRLDEINEKDLPGAPFNVDIMFSYSRCMIQAEMSWIDGMIARFESPRPRGKDV
jgi:DNA-binding PadR family transcriptional regulator